MLSLSIPLTVCGFCFAAPWVIASLESHSSPLLNSSEPQLFPPSTFDTGSRSNRKYEAIPSVNATNAINPTCFSQPPNPSDPRLHTIIIDDCLEVLYEVLRIPNAPFPNLWDSRLGRFPVWNVFGTCAVGLLPRFSTSHDLFTELLIAHVAAVVIERCVKVQRGEKVGGISWIGARNEFEVCVYGRDPAAVGVLGTNGMNDTASI